MTLRRFLVVVGLVGCGLFVAAAWRDAGPLAALVVVACLLFVGVCAAVNTRGDS